MRIITLTGATESGHNEALAVLADNAGEPVTSAKDFNAASGMLLKGTVGLAKSTFIEGVDDNLMVKIKKLGKQYDNTYVIVVAMDVTTKQ